MTAGGNLFDVLERIIDAGEAACPACRIERQVFGHRVLALIDMSASDPEEALQQLNAADLYLATGCARRDPGAVSLFVKRYLAMVPSYLGKLGNAVSADEVRSALEDTLILGRDGREPRIAQYAGRGSLDAFVATAARNIARTMLRPKASDRSTPVEEADLADCSSTDETSQSPDARHDLALQEAVRTSLQVLDKRQRTIVRLHLLEGVSLTQIGRMLQVNQSTVSRALSDALHLLYGKLRTEIELRTRLNDSEMTSLLRDAGARMDLSLTRLLRDTLTDR